VEAAGVEPASGNTPQWRLHTYPEFWISRLGLLQAGFRKPPAWLNFASNRIRHPVVGYPAVMTPLTGPAGKTRKDGSCLKQLQRSYNRLLLCLSTAFLTSQRTSVCNHYFHIPVEAVSPP